MGLCEGVACGKSVLSGNSPSPASPELPCLRGSCPKGTEGVSAQVRVAPCHESSATRIAWWNGCRRSPQEKAPASLWKRPLGSRYFFFGFGGGETKPSTLIAIASLLRFAGTPRIKEASSTPVEGSLVAPKITAFAPTLAARSCIDLWKAAISVRVESPVEVRIATSL